MAELHTARLLIRPWRDQDLAAFAALNADPRVMEYFPACLSTAQSHDLAARIQAGIERRGWGFWALQELHSGEFIGFTGLEQTHDMPFADGVEIGWRLAHAWWGKGLAGEAARAALQFAFEEVALDQVIAFTSTGNWRSRRLMARLGMENTDQDFDHPRLPPDSPLRRHVLYQISSGQFQADSDT